MKVRTCVRRMSVRGKKEFEVRRIDRNERISDIFLLPWYVVNKQCKVLDILKHSFIPINLYSIIVIP